MDVGQYRKLGCSQCLEGVGLDFDFSFAFQPIVNAADASIFAYEALARGLEGQGAATVFANVNPTNLYAFDQACRTRAIALAVELGLDCKLNINFTPNAIYRPELCIRTTLEAARAFDFPPEQIVFEVTEGEKVVDHDHLRNIFETYRELGFGTAIDDFGAGYSGLNLLAEYQPHFIKLDRALISNIHQHRARQIICRGILQVCYELDIVVLAEGVECREEYLWLRDAGVTLFQGYYFARPGFRCLPEVDPACF